MCALISKVEGDTKAVTAYDVLVRARSLIAEPENWTQEVHARNETGSEEEPFSPNACQWCAIAALQRAYLETSRDCSEFPPMNAAYNAAYDTLAEVVGRDLETWNDDKDTTHGKIISVFDESIRMSASE